MKILYISRKAMLRRFFIIALLSILNTHLYCCGGRSDYTKRMTIIEREHVVQHRRLLMQTEGPHGIRIKAQYLDSAKQSGHLEEIEVLFDVAAAYYRRVIKLYSLPDYATQFRTNNPDTTFSPDDANICVPIVPTKYIFQGFNQNDTDMVLLVQHSQLPNGTLFLDEYGCQFETRILYGLIIYDFKARNNQFESSQFKFHGRMIETLHQFTHLLGFQDRLYGLFSESPFEYKKMPREKVIQKINNRFYIVSPNVKEYVKKYFNCNDNQTGALLQDEYSDIFYHHWETLVYRNQFMVALLETRQRITKLTLALLKDTNFYAEVDDSLTDEVFYGSGRGCKFARGDPSEFTNECVTSSTSSSSNCDFYNEHFFYCNKTQLSNNLPIERSYDNLICIIPVDFLNMTFGKEDSRCLLSGSKRVPACQRAVCVNDGSQIIVTVNNKSNFCNKPGKTRVMLDDQITVDGRIIYCPKNFTVFCSVKPCPKWCNGHGMCVDGKCICMDPFKGQTCKDGCPIYFNNGIFVSKVVTNQCTSKCPNGTYLLFNKTCVDSCPYDYLPNDLRQCQHCENCEKELASIKNSFRCMVKIFTVICVLFITI